MPKKNNAKKSNAESEPETIPHEGEDEAPKTSKFLFKCTRCEAAAPNACCCMRGNIPLTLWDLELWAKNKVVANMLPHLAIEVTPAGLVDLVIKSAPREVGDNAEPTDATTEETETGASNGDKKELRCGFLSGRGSRCLI